MDRHALHKLSYGIYVLTTKVDGTPYGCIINTAFQVTSEPPKIAVSCNRDNFTHDKIVKSGMFAISTLAEDSDAEIIKTFGYKSGRDVDKFAKLPATDGPALGLPLFPTDSVALFECRVTDQLEVGTHTIFIGEVADCSASRPDAREMTYRFYHEIRKGSAPKNAPSYIAEDAPRAAAPAADESSEKNLAEKWRCTVCGYVHSKGTPFEELPDDWVCPVCGAPKSKFVKLAG